MAKTGDLPFEERAALFFDQADLSGDGSLDKFELCKVCIGCGCNEKTAEMADWFDDLDTNDDGKILKDEFLNALSKIPPKEVEEADLRAAFRDLDSDGSGFITVEDMQQVLTKKQKDDKKAMLGDMDLNEDGKVGIEEFLEAMRC